MKQVQQMYTGVRHVLRERKNIFPLVIFALLFFAFFVSIPVYTTPYNNFAFLGAIALLLFSLYFSARRVCGVCVSCCQKQ